MLCRLLCIVAYTQQIRVLLFEAFLEFLVFLFFNVFDPWLVESVDVKPMGTEG